MTQKAHTKEQYDVGWDKWSDMIRYNPGARHRRRILLQSIRTLPFRTLLDVGCGDGELLSAIQKRYPYAELTGVDLSPSVLEKNRTRHPSIRFETLDLQQAALASNFDLVLCSEVIEHLEDRPKAFLHLAQMVNSNGYLFITAPTGRVYPTERMFGHTTHPNSQELEELAKQSGLRVIWIANWGFPLYKWLKWGTNLNAEWAVERFANGAYSPFQKGLAHLLYGCNFFNLAHSKSGCQLFALFQKI